MAPKKGFKHSAETRIKMRISHLGVKRPEIGKLISLSLKGRPKTEQHKAAMRVPKILSDETRNAMKKRWRENVQAAALKPEARAKAVATFTGYRHTPEAKERMSLAIRSKPRSEAQIRAARLSTHRGPVSEKERQATSFRSKALWASGKFAVPKRWRYTKLAQSLHAYLNSRGVVVEPEISFWPYTVDLYDRVNHIAYEADGTYWHALLEQKRPNYTANRDKLLFTEYDLMVIHYTDNEIKNLTKRV